MRLTNKTHYGIQLVTYLAKESNDWQTLPDLAQKLRIPLSFLKQIAVALRKHRILLSQGGKYGGYRLARPSRAITIAEIFKALDEPIALQPCRTRHCTHRTCLTGKFWETVTNNLKGAFEASNLEIIVSMSDASAHR